MIKAFLCAATLVTASVAAAMANDDGANVKLVYDQPLPNVPGKSMRGVLVEYEPGGSSPAHTHPHSAFIYATVLEGTIRSQVNDRPVMIITASAKMPARRSALACSPCWSSTRTRPT